MTPVAGKKKARKLKKIPGTPAGCSPWDSQRDKQGSTGQCPRDFLSFDLEKLTLGRPGGFQKCYVNFSHVPPWLPERRCEGMRCLCGKSVRHTDDTHAFPKKHLACCVKFKDYQRVICSSQRRNALPILVPPTVKCLIQELNFCWYPPSKPNPKVAGTPVGS